MAQIKQKDRPTYIRRFFFLITKWPQGEGERRFKLVTFGDVVPSRLNYPYKEHRLFSSSLLGKKKNTTILSQTSCHLAKHFGVTCKLKNSKLPDLAI